MIQKIIPFLILIGLLFFGCSVTGPDRMPAGIQEGEWIIIRKYVGQYDEYRFTRPGLMDPNVCWVKTSFDARYGKIPVSGRQIKYKPGEDLYIRRIHFSLPGQVVEFWTYQLESNQSRYVYILKSDHVDQFYFTTIFDIKDE